MRLGVSLYTIGVMCFLRIELLLVVTVYVYPCDVPYLVICLICDGGYHMFSYTDIGNVMSSIYVCTSPRKVRVIEVLTSSQSCCLSTRSCLCTPKSVIQLPPHRLFLLTNTLIHPGFPPLRVYVCVCVGGEVQLRPGLVRGGRWIGGSGGPC